MSPHITIDNIFRIWVAIKLVKRRPDGLCLPAVGDRFCNLDNIVNILYYMNILL